MKEKAKSSSRDANGVDIIIMLFSCLLVPGFLFGQVRPTFLMGWLLSINLIFLNFNSI